MKRAAAEWNDIQDAVARSNAGHDDDAVVHATRVAAELGDPSCSTVRALCSLDKTRFDAAAMRLKQGGRHHGRAVSSWARR